MSIRLPFAFAAVFSFFSSVIFAQDWYVDAVPEIIIPQATPYYQSSTSGGGVEYSSSGYYGVVGDAYANNAYGEPSSYVSRGYGSGDYYYPTPEPVTPMPGSYSVSSGASYYTNTPYAAEVYEAPVHPSQPSHPAHPSNFSGTRPSLPGRYNGVSEDESGLETGELKRRSSYERGTFGGSYQAGGVFSAGVESRFGGALQPGAGRR